MKNAQVLQLIKRAVELAMPNFRSYYRVVRKAKVVKSYASDGQYWADVQPLRNDESVDENEPVVPKVEIPILWAGPERGVVCPPLAGAYCDLEYYDGDPNYPRISNFRWHGNAAPDCEVGAFVLQADPTTFIKIDAQKNLIEVTPSEKTSKIGGNATAQVGGDKSETIGGTWTIKAPLIIQEGNTQSTGPNGKVGHTSVHAHTEQTGSLTLVGHIQCSSLTVAGDTDIGGNCNAASRSGGKI